MAPILEVLKDGRERASRECRTEIADLMQLTVHDRSQMLASGQRLVYVNRIDWATVELVLAGLVARPARGVLQITERGKQVLASHPDGFEKAVLRQFPEYVEAMSRSSQKAGGEAGEGELVGTAIGQDSTPDEVIASGFQRYNSSLVAEVLGRVRTVPPAFFERLVVQLLVAMGYGGSFEDAARVVGRSGDDGIDGVIKEDRLGLDAIYIQAKRWQGSVGRPVVAEFVGNLAPHQSSKGVLITTSTFTEDARRWIEQVGRRIVLVDGQQLAELMIEHGVGVTPVRTYTLKRIDNDYFDEGP